MAAGRLDLKLRVGFLALLATGFGLAAIGPARQALEQHRAIEMEEQKFAALRSANSQLQQDLARLNDQEYLEKEAREQLGLVRPGETSYIVERPPARPPTRQAPLRTRTWLERAWDSVSSMFR